jgi:hypothetical protein
MLWSFSISRLILEIDSNLKSLILKQQKLFSKFLNKFETKSNKSVNSMTRLWLLSIVSFINDILHSLQSDRWLDLIKQKIKTKFKLWVIETLV